MAVWAVLIGHPDAPNVTLSGCVSHYGGPDEDPLPFTLYMVLLSAALAATAGAEDPEWLRQFDLEG